MKAITVRQVAVRITAWADANPARGIVVTGKPRHEYRAGQRPGEAGPEVANELGMRPCVEKVLATLRAAGRMTRQDRERLGPWQSVALNALNELSNRGLARREGSTWFPAREVA